ncbi:MAG: hypothetical protein ACRYFS_13365 [Janthinobacterium lividum]
MNVKTLLVVIGIAGAAVLVYKKMTEANSEPPKADHSQVVPLIEQTLQEHEGETGSVVQAFEAALAKETA